MVKRSTKWLKRHFIPHVGNAYRPHFLVGQNIRQLLGVVLGFELLLFVLPGLNFAGFVNSLNLGAVLPSVLSTLTNVERSERNLPALSTNPVLDKAAQLKAEDMAAKGYFAHFSPEGKSPWYWFDQVGYDYYYAGENLAVNFIDSKDVTAAWMNSPSHRANIIQYPYTEIGTGVATGTFQGYESVFVAQVYAQPRAANPNLNAAAANFFELAFASPKHTTDAVLYTVIGIVAFALLFNIFVKARHQHPDLIMNAAIVMIFVLAIHIANGYISDNQGLKTSFMAFESER